MSELWLLIQKAQLYSVRLLSIVDGLGVGNKTREISRLKSYGSPVLQIWARKGPWDLAGNLVGKQCEIQGLQLVGEPGVLLSCCGREPAAGDLTLNISQVPFQNRNVFEPMAQLHSSVPSFKKVMSEVKRATEGKTNGSEEVCKSRKIKPTPGKALHVSSKHTRSDTSASSWVLKPPSPLEVVFFLAHS